MKTSKLVNILKALTKTEISRFREFIISPFFNKNEIVIGLFDILHEAYPTFQQKKVDRVVVFNRLYPRVEFNEQKLRYPMSDLAKLLEEFLELQEFSKNKIARNHLLVQAFLHRNLHKYSQSVIDQAILSNEKNQYRDFQFYYDMFLLETDRYDDVSSKRNVAVKENLKSIIQNLDNYYIINKLKYSAEIINHANVWAGDFEPLLLDEILVYLDKHRDKNVPAVEIYYMILMTLLEPDNESHYFHLKKALTDSLSLFPQSEINDMYIFARNYCAKKINFGDLNYLVEIFDLYKILLESEIIFQNGFLVQWDFKNIVSVALRLEEYDWTEKFIEKYKDNLRPEEKQNAHLYNLALLQYHKKEYDKTLELLRDVEFTDVYYHLDCKSLLLKTYFENEEIDALSSLMDTFYVYLRRNKLISDYNRTSYSNFLRFVKKILKAKYRNKAFVNLLSEELRQTPVVANLTWLKKKIEELT